MSAVIATKISLENTMSQAIEWTIQLNIGYLRQLSPAPQNPIVFFFFINIYFLCHWFIQRKVIYVRGFAKLIRHYLHGIICRRRITKFSPPFSYYSAVCALFFYGVYAHKIWAVLIDDKQFFFLFLVKRFDYISTPEIWY